MAVWELMARREGVPLYRLLGGRGGTIEAGVSVGLQPDDAALARAGGGRGRGGLPAGQGEDQARPRRGARLAAIRERFPDLPLMVDANCAYTLDDAEHLRDLDRFGLMMIEQPLAWDDIVDHATLQKRLADARSASTSRSALPTTRATPSSSGPAGSSTSRWDGWAASPGPSASTTRAVAAGAPGLVRGHGRVGHRAPGQRAPADPARASPCPGDTSASARYFEEDLVDPPVVVSPDGTIAVPEGPGLGHEIVWPRVERATRFERPGRRP